MNKKQCLKIAAFLLLVILVLFLLSLVFNNADASTVSRLRTYTELDADSVDAVYIGTSGVHRYWVPGYAYHNYGLTVYPRTVKGCRAWHVLTLVRYAYKYQSPRLVIVDCRPFVSETSDDYAERNSRFFSESLPWSSPFRYQAILRTVKYSSQFPEGTAPKISFWLPIFRYHDRWSTGINTSYFTRERTKSLGYLISMKTKPMPESTYSTESEEISWFAKECLDELLKYSADNGIHLLFVDSPRYINEKRSKQANWFYAYLEQKGIPCFELCSEGKLEDYGIDRTADFKDKLHMNYLGAQKYTGILSEYLLENYDFKDRRADNLEAWEGAYEKFLKDIENHEEQED